MSAHPLEPNPLARSVTTSSEPSPLAGGWVVTGSSVSVHHEVDIDRFYRHGWHSWGAASWVDIHEPPVVPAVELLGAQTDDPAVLYSDIHAGRWVGAVEDVDGQGIVLGSLGFDAVVTADDQSVTGSGPDGTEWFVWLGDVDVGLEAYARLLGARWGSRRRRPGPIWCSWYAYYRDIDPAGLRATLDEVRRFPFDVFQIDDGWQREVGEWVENDRFEGTMASLAAEITGVGLTPGLWMAPFIAHERSAVSLDHPDWLVRDDHGRPVPAGENFGGVYYGLDLTHPDAVEWVAESVQRAIDWGYRYLKLDFLFGSAIQGVRTEAISPESAYRRGAELIRSVVGEDVYLLACGAPIVPSIGVFDAIRVGTDVAPIWVDGSNERYVRDFSIPSTRHGIASTLGRMWLREVIAVDPDVAYFRSRYNLLTDEQRSWLEQLAVATGFVATSDPPSWLGPDEQAHLREVLTSDPAVRRDGRFRYRIGDTAVDFGAALADGHGLCGLCTLIPPGPSVSAVGTHPA